MATAGKNIGDTSDVGGGVQGPTGQTGSTTTPSRQVKGSIGSPISNEAYNVVTALQAKLEGLEAYRKYAQDGDGGIWHELQQFDLKAVDRLIDELEILVKDGRFRMNKPGSAH